MENAPAEVAKALIAESSSPFSSSSDAAAEGADRTPTNTTPPTKGSRRDTCGSTFTASTTDSASPGTMGSLSDIDSLSASPSTASGDCLWDRLENGTSESVARQVVPALPLAAPAQQRLYWEAFFVNLPMFCGYAALFGLQHEIKTKFAISDDDESASVQFGVACSFLYIFNLIFRFSHNIVFGFMGPRGRTYMAMLAMMGSMLVIAFAIFIYESRHFGWVMLAYGLGGVGVGSFEANYLCCLTPLGPRTKHLAITAIPIGITTVLVGGFLAMGPPFHVTATSIYLAVAALILAAMLLFAVRIPDIKIQSSDSSAGIRRFVSELRQWRQWLPLVWHLPIATAIDMFSLSAFSPGVALYIFDAKSIPLLPGLSLANPDFFCVYNTFNMVGGLCGRYLSYRIRPRHPAVYTVFNIVGASMLLLKNPVLAPISTFLVMMGDGLIYGTIARRIDAVVPKQFNLVALSFWLFIGDFGSVIGSNLIAYIRVWVVGH